MNHSYRRVRIYLITAFMVFMAGAVTCMLIRPDLFDHPDYGLSFFGSIRATLLPYCIGLLTAAYCLWSIAKELVPYKQARPLRRGYLVGAACIVAIVLTPMALHPVVWWTHIGITLVLMLNQIVVSIWVLRQKGNTGIDYLLGAIFFAGGIAAVLSGTWPGILGMLAIGQLVVFASNILLLGRAALRVVSQKP